MNHSLQDRVIALAALFQSVKLVDDLAYSGRTDEVAMDATLGSLLRFDADNVPDIFGGVPALRPGLELLQRILGNQGSEKDLRLTRYLVTLIGHANRVLKDSELAENLRRRLERNKQQKTHFETWDEPVMASLADTYVSTIGTLEPRIMVKGDPGTLQQPRVVDGVRALLLGGIRAAVLWQQTGGRRWQLLFNRRRLLDATEALLADA